MSDVTRDYSFGGWVKYFRLQKKLTLREAARKIKMDSGNLSKLERSLLDPPLNANRVRILCKKLEFNDVAEELLVSIAFQYRFSKFHQEFFK
jgi:transcriptional regulator with XRE-family HTH domain